MIVISIIKYLFTLLGLGMLTIAFCLFTTGAEIEIGGLIVLCVLGVVFFGVGFSIIMHGRLKAKKIQYLKAKGTKTIGGFDQVIKNGSLSVNGQNPYQILVKWKDPYSSQRYILKSDNIWFDPTNHINNKNMTVFIDRNNPKKYHVDLSFLPKMAE